jgi:nucleoside 2-deoxyribosyltransferase
MGGVKAFFASPFAREYDWVRNAVAKACRELDIELRAVDEKATPGANLVVAIHEEIEQADLAVIVLTGLNPNVMYEMGRVLQASKPAVLLADDDTFKALPFDIRAFATIKYDAKSKNETHLATVVARSLAIAKDALSHSFREQIAAGKYRSVAAPETPTAVQTMAVTTIDFEEVRKEAQKRIGRNGCQTVDIETKDSGWEQTLKCPGGDLIIVIIDINGDIVRIRVR